MNLQCRSHGVTVRCNTNSAHPPIGYDFLSLPRENRQTGGSPQVMTPSATFLSKTSSLGPNAQPLEGSRAYLSPLSGSRLPSYSRKPSTNSFSISLITGVYLWSRTSPSILSSRPRESNPQPADYKSAALPIVLRRHLFSQLFYKYYSKIFYFLQIISSGK